MSADAASRHCGGGGELLLAPAVDGPPKGGVQEESARCSQGQIVGITIETLVSVDVDNKASRRFVQMVVL